MCYYITILPLFWAYFTLHYFCSLVAFLGVDVFTNVTAGLFSGVISGFFFFYTRCLLLFIRRWERGERVIKGMGGQVGG